MQQLKDQQVYGKIIKGIGGLYYVHSEKVGVLECYAKGIFRNRKMKPLVGDNVTVDILDITKATGNIVEIHERTNELIRPAVANVDQALLIFAVADPAPNLNLLDRFLVMMERQKVETVICFNKLDIVSDDEVEKLKEVYAKCGYQVLFVSAINDYGIQDILRLMEGKTTVFAGPSGVGKSSIINLIQPEANMETGVISEKIKRGKHTTRHSELFHVDGNSYMMDTPGFTSLYIDEVDKDELKEYYHEFHEFAMECQFADCVHLNEPKCGVKDALTQGKISQVRYDNYRILYEEIKDIKKY